MRLFRCLVVIAASLAVANPVYIEKSVFLSFYTLTDIRC